MRFRIFALFFVFVLTVPFAAHAGIPSFGPIIPANAATCPAGWGLLIVVINNIISVLLTLAIVFIAPLMIAYSGFLLVVNSVNPAGKEQAKKILMNTVIGIVVALAGWLIVDAIMAVLYNPGNGLGTWSSLISSGGSAQCLTVAGALSPAGPRTTPPATVVPTGTTPTYTGSTDEQSVRARLAAAGVQINNAPCPAGSDGKGCTNVGGMKPDTIQQILNIANACGGLRCSMVITGGTEPGHAAGTYSHANGYKIDFGLNSSALNSYFESFALSGQRGGDFAGPIRTDSCGNEYVKESNHWDVTVKTPCGGSGGSTSGPVSCPTVNMPNVTLGPENMSGGGYISTGRNSISLPEGGGLTVFELLAQGPGIITPIVIPPFPSAPAGYKPALKLSQGQGTMIPGGTVTTEFSVSQCPGVIDTSPSNPNCYYSNTAILTNEILVSPDASKSDSCPTPGGGPWYINVKWTYDQCQSTSCGFSMQFSKASGF